MSRPWSQAGIAPEWRELLAKYVIGFVVVGLIILVATFQCGRGVGHNAGDQAVAAEEARQHRLEMSLRVQERRNDSLSRKIDTLRARLATDSTHAAALHAESLRREAGITIDSVSHFMRVASSDTAIAVDTVAYADVQRPNDERHYPIPRFFTDSYTAIRADRNAAYVDARDAQLIVQVLTAKAASVDSADAVRDSINASLRREVATLKDRRGSWCQFRCGVVTTLGLLAAAAVTLHEVRR